MDAGLGPDTRGAEAAVIIGVQLPDESDEEAMESLAELEALAETAGAQVQGSILQKRTSYNPSTVLGSGKVKEAGTLVKATDSDLVIFDNDLTVSQQDRLSSALGARVIDRKALILDIFAQHAHTREGRTQVELAQYSYLLPRIRGRGVELSRMGGGIGTRRGPGETKLEVDRRRIRKRMRKLEADLTQMESVRTTQRKQRIRAGLPSVSLVGYTNSGKSTLLNRFTGAGVLVEDQLFSTLDSTTRRLVLADGRTAVLSDTVGFIRKLPHELVAAFRSTLEVVREADLLIHVVEARGEEFIGERMQAVDEVLSDLGASDTPRVIALNKVDTLEPQQRLFLRRRYPSARLISARTGEGIDELLAGIADNLTSLFNLTLSIPAGRGDIIASVYRDGFVSHTEVSGDRIVMRVGMPAEKADRYSGYISEAPPEIASNWQD